MLSRLQVAPHQDPARGRQAPRADSHPPRCGGRSLPSSGSVLRGGLTLDEEIRAAHAGRLREGAQELAGDFLERVVAGGQEIAWHAVFTLRDRPGVDAYAINAEELRVEFATWLHRVNAAVSPIGKHYRRQFGHSFFAYLAGPDWGKSTGRGHLHAALGYLPVEVAERYWNPRGRGKLWLRRVSPADLLQRVRYVAFEACKGGDPHLWIPRKAFDYRAELVRAGARADALAGVGRASVPPGQDPTNLPEWFDW